MTALTRRRFIAISAAALTASGAAAASREFAHWRGQALGARAEVLLRGISRAEASPLFRRVEAELSRLEALFSLYRTDSALVRLNRDGVLHDPEADFLHLLSLARSVHVATGGAFDPTVQPLFALHADAAARGRSATPDEMSATRGRIGFDHVSIAPTEIRFDRPGMGMTFNGIAQGFATDRVAAVLRREGLRDVLVDAGEIRATGGEGGWPVQLPGGIVVRLTDRAVATSDAAGTLVDPKTGIGHIFDPRNAGTTPRTGAVSVFHESAAMADAVSTAATVMEVGHLRSLNSLDLEFSFSPGFES